MLSSSDPFYAFQTGMESRFNDVEVKFNRWKSLLNAVNTAQDSSFQTLHEGVCVCGCVTVCVVSLCVWMVPCVCVCADLKSDIEAANNDLRGIQLAVGAVERQRSKFSHVDDAELAKRKAFVSTMSDKCVCVPL